MTNVTDPATAGGPSGASRGGRRRVTLVLLAIVAVLAVILTGGALAYAKQFEGKALPGTTVLGQDVSGQTPAQISSMVAERAEGVTVSVTAGDEVHEVSLADLGASVDADATAAAAVEREDDFGAVISSTWSGEHPVDPVVSVDEQAVSDFASSLVPEDRTDPENASVSYDEDADEWSVSEATPGLGVDPTELVETVTAQAATLSDFSVEQPIEEIAPAITTEEAEETLASITSVLDQSMTVTDPEGDTLEISSERRSSWMSVAESEDGKSLELSVDEDAVREWVSERAAKSTVEAKDGIEQVDADGEVVEVVAEKTDGLEVTNTDAVADQLIEALKGTTALEATFESRTVEADVEQVAAPEEEDEATEEESSEEEATTEDEEEAAEEEATPTGEKWIDVNLSDKTVTAYVGDTPVWGPRSMVDGGEGYETVTGTYEIYLRYDMQDMTNASRYDEDDEEYYYTEDVPWVQYFHGGYGFHGAPWRSSFGYSGSHGCINLPVSDAKWLYDWAGIGVRVESHY